MQDRPTQTIWSVIAAAPMWLAAAVLFLLMAMTFLDVLSRSIFNNPIESATELTRLFMAIMVFAALPLVTWRGEHIVVDLMDPLFTRRMGWIRDILVDLACGVAILFPAKRVFDLAERARDYGDKTEYLGLPQFYIGWFIAAFAFLTALVFLLRGVTQIVAPHKLPGKEPLE
ncbi:MAG: TRAP transporter small permease [Silicimonas sp.]|nr:TRAP transporter small permease [Silicimonas sp.]